VPRALEVPQYILESARKTQTSVSLKQMLDYGEGMSETKLINSAKFLHHELPIRLAHRVKDLSKLPLGLNEQKSVQLVRDWYMQSWQELDQFKEIRTPEDEMKFTKMIEHIRTRHSGVLITLARGIYELKMSLVQHFGTYKSVEKFLTSEEESMLKMQQFLEHFHTSRIGIRVLISHHSALHEPFEGGWVGIINSDTSPSQEALSAAEQAKSLCMNQYGDAPEVQIVGDLDFSFPYVPGQLHHIFFEVIKNSMRATCEKVECGEDELPDYPPIKIIICDGDDDVSIKITDEGGGIKRSHMNDIFKFTFSTVQQEGMEGSVLDHFLGNDGGTDYGSSTPMAGLGYGLPISRLYARYFGGELSILSMEGYGTDAYLHLKKVSDSNEPLV